MSLFTCMNIYKAVAKRRTSRCDWLSDGPHICIYMFSLIKYHSCGLWIIHFNAFLTRKKEKRWKRIKTCFAVYQKHPISPAGDSIFSILATEHTTREEYK